MKIALLGPYPPPLGGVSTTVMHLSRLLREDGYQVRIFVEEKEQASASPVTHWYPARSLHPSRNLLLKVREYGPDVLHSHASTVRKYDALIARLLSVPLIYQIYGERFPEQFSRWSFWSRRLTAWSFRQARTIIPACRELAQFVRSFGIAPDKIVLIPCLLPLEPPAVTPLGFPARMDAVLKNKDNKIVLVTSGFYETHYGLSMVPRIAADLESRQIDFFWVIVGPGSKKEITSVQEAIDEAGVGDRVVQAGEIDRAQMIALLGAAQVYVRTKSSDSFGIVIAEAHQLGCCCLFADNNPYFRADGKRLFSYRAGSRESITEELLKILARLDPRASRDTESRFRTEAEAHYRQIKQLYRRAVSND